MRGLQPRSPSQIARQNRVNVPGLVGAIWQPLYDFQTYANGGVASQRFFSVPRGQGGKTEQDTNMELSGQIPKGQKFDITGIEVAFYPGGTILSAAANEYADDIREVYQNGALDLVIGSRSFCLQAPLGKFPPTAHMEVDAASTAAGESISFAYPIGREYATVNMELVSNQNFSVLLTGLPALPSGVDGRIGVTLNGFLYRNAQ